MEMNALLQAVKYDANGLVVAIAQDAETGEILMVAYMNEATLRQTLETGLMTYWSRSRQEVWVKGATSGHTQEVREVRIDCDGDVLLFKIKQNGGAACHTGHRSCFYRKLENGRLVETEGLVFNPEQVYSQNNR
ncbi:phosphoribosyl-AMP cyclohydrolase [Rhodothermus bifroesti]|uniref:Phosphoribosyl-AMP cyclohydrolase n=1 Tax=Rhodothermus marinus TaxID=29549 RepID=A0A7V2F6L3_RHOMR|nr:Phosphoribosyl-AMP cyclohydrolase [bacterium HR18]